MRTPWGGAQIGGPGEDALLRKSARMVMKEAALRNGEISFCSWPIAPPQNARRVAQPFLAVRFSLDLIAFVQINLRAPILSAVLRKGWVLTI